MRSYATGHHGIIRPDLEPWSLSLNAEGRMYPEFRFLLWV